MYFVPNIFLKAQDRIRFYIFSQIITSLKKTKVSGYAMIYSTGDFYLHFITIFVLIYRIFWSIPTSLENMARSLIQGRQVFPHSTFHTPGQKDFYFFSLCHSYLISFHSPSFNIHLHTNTRMHILTNNFNVQTKRSKTWVLTI